MSSNDQDDALTSQNNRTDLEIFRATCDKQPDPDSQPNCSTFAEPMKQTGLTNPEEEKRHETEENTTTAHITSQASPNNQPHLKSKASDKDFQGDNEDQNSKESSHKHDDPSTKTDEEAELNTRNHYDAGWAWFVCGTTFLMEFFVGGMITSSGVIYAALLAEFKKSRAETGMTMLHVRQFLLVHRFKSCSPFYNFSGFFIHLLSLFTYLLNVIHLLMFHLENSSISLFFHGSKKKAGPEFSIEIMIISNLFLI